MTTSQHATTLRLDEALYRRAKAAAAAQGLTLTRFIEEGLQLRLREQPVRQAFKLHSYDSGHPFTSSPEELRKMGQETDWGGALQDAEQQ